MSATRAGMILGTAAYMSPEQARGKTVDRRADIWAFGVVLYEMLTGKQTFTGETITDILASVVKEQPSLDRLPARVRKIVERCLQKDPRQRWQAIGDVRLEIDALLADPDGNTQTREPEYDRYGSVQFRWCERRFWPSAITALVACELQIVHGASVSRFAVALARDSVLRIRDVPVVAISPDGTRMVYVANRRFYLRPMAATGGEAHSRHLMSPAGSRVLCSLRMAGRLRILTTENWFLSESP